MASPHTAGMAALVRQAHPKWKKVPYWKAAIVNTADPGKVTGYTTRVAGSGLVQAPGATQTQVVALGDRGTAALNYGFAELGRDYVDDQVDHAAQLQQQGGDVHVGHRRRRAARTPSP